MIAQSICDERGSGRLDSLLEPRLPNSRQNWIYPETGDTAIAILFERSHPRTYDLRVERRHGKKSFLGQIEFSAAHGGWIINYLDRTPHHDHQTHLSYEDAALWLYEQFLESKRQALKLALSA
ncbi:hypothetical protein [Myxacorys almedinensis]|uniref:Uncharacterized protein n=1 Tax=Myxacorys almedinensis A TaxID=2690445 RepID=A0A8J8CK35_9CYAN|nr:hypothetical protein [Myxacorys almedinensis]NDJ19473.1 hypothetical protein [Myxacorys almedinensis A]